MVAAMMQSNAERRVWGILSAVGGCEILRRLRMTKGVAGLRLDPCKVGMPGDRGRTMQGSMRAVAAGCVGRGNRRPLGMTGGVAGLRFGHGVDAASSHFATAD